MTRNRIFFWPNLLRVKFKHPEKLFRCYVEIKKKILSSNIWGTMAERISALDLCSDG